jgi:exodeoxyribonuclease-3
VPAVKVTTWNLNSIRARTERLTAWLEREKPSAICIQETKVEDGGFPHSLFEKLGYHVATFGQRSYNGVAIASTAPLADVARTFEDGGEEDGSRLIAATTHGIRLICVYVPNGQALDSDRYPYKLAWLRRLRAYLDRTALPETILCGDMNVTIDDRDVWAPDQWKDKIHCSQPERDALAEVTAYPLVDLFRANQAEGGVYSWWDYRGVSFFKNQGLRIDFVFGTQKIADRCIGVSIDRTARKGQDASDHAPVTAELA